MYYKCGINNDGQVYLHTYNIYGHYLLKKYTLERVGDMYDVIVCDGYEFIPDGELYPLPKDFNLKKYTTTYTPIPF